MIVVRNLDRVNDKVARPDTAEVRGVVCVRRQATNGTLEGEQPNCHVVAAESVQLRPSRGRLGTPVTVLYLGEHLGTMGTSIGCSPVHVKGQCTIQ